MSHYNGADGFIRLRYIAVHSNAETFHESPALRSYRLVVKHSHLMKLIPEVAADRRRKLARLICSLCYTHASSQVYNNNYLAILLRRVVHCRWIFCSTHRYNGKRTFTRSSDRVGHFPLPLYIWSKRFTSPMNLKTILFVSPV